MKKLIMGVFVFALFASMISANMALSGTSGVEGQVYTLNFECYPVGATAQVSRDGVYLGTTTCDSYGTSYFVDHTGLDLGLNEYTWTGGIFHICTGGSCVDAYRVYAVPNDADTLNGSTLADIHLFIDIEDAQVLADANDYTDGLEDGLLDGTIIVAHSSYADNAGHANIANYAYTAGHAYHANFANVAGYAYNSDRLDGWHGWQYRRYTRQWVMWEHNRAVARENQIESDSKDRDQVLQDNIDAEEARATAEEQRIEQESKDRDAVLQDNIDAVDDKHTDWNNAQDERLDEHDATLDNHEVRITDLEGDVHDLGNAVNGLNERVTKLEYQFEYVEGEVNIKTPAHQYADFSAMCGIKEAPRFIAQAGREAYDEEHTENRADYYLDAVLNAFMVGDGETGLTVEECVYIPYQYAGRDYNEDGGVSVDEGTTFCTYYPYAQKERDMYPCELNREWVNYNYPDEKFVIRKDATGTPEFFVETTTEKILVKTKSGPSFDYNEFLCGMGINC